MSNLIVIRIFLEGGWIMWPILLTSIVALSVIVERMLWWYAEWSKRDRGKLVQIYAALEQKDVKGAAELAGASQDSILRVLWFALSQHPGTLPSALQVGAAIELERAGRFIVVMDTVVTLAPLLGLLGTVTGLMRAFFKLGTTELSEEAIGGGIAEALIATACGLTIAAVSLVFLNYLVSNLAKFKFELQTACGKIEILLHYHLHPETSDTLSSPIPEAPDPSSLTPPSMSPPAP